MKSILQNIRRYFAEINKWVLIAVSVFTAAGIIINYHFSLDAAIRKNNSVAVKLICWYAVFLAAFSIPYLITLLARPLTHSDKKNFLLFILLAPFLFALKLSLDIPLHFSDDHNWNKYWNHIVYWPLLLLIITGILLLLWKLYDRDQPFYGIKTKGINWTPYLIMLLLMLPLIAAASTQADFLAVYPKLNTIAGISNEPGLQWWHKLLFELSYGSDFIGIELFFRGFLVLAFVKWAGKDAILPMACFYCTIHFGKPLGECISSYFGGIILGVVVYNTRSILGGLLVHLGIAWLMELGGYIGNVVK
ncbi:MAG: CPBP family intramembrane glutamic endopeptidase [Chitinophagaceae bacterium]